MTYLGRLVPLSRAIRLDEDGVLVTVANGLDYPPFPAFREASATIITRKDELVPLSASPGRSLWRQLSAVTVKRRAAAANAGPLALTHLAESNDAVLWVGALMAAGNGKLVDVVESTYSLPAGMFSEFGRAAYEKGIAYANERETALTRSVKSYATILFTAPSYERARQYYWTFVEQHLSALFDLARDIDLVVDLPNSSWGKAVDAAAVEAYEQSCPRGMPRQIEAYARGLRKITYRSNTEHSTPIVYE
jgi:CRISPR system Cascade subunit CasA